MIVEMLTYAALAARLGISTEAARALAKRRRLPRSRLADGKAVVSVDLAEIRYTPRLACKAAIQSEVEIMKAEIARLEAAVAGHQADFERERARADRLMAELLTMTTQAATAREEMGRLEGELLAKQTADRGRCAVPTVSRQE
ncbi:MAG TPA: hypothetical protein VLR92_11765, partial [Blastocatellia bacterium]|nr:hypothetical protein [Blastocatellia bacterium]